MTIDDSKPFETITSRRPPSVASQIAVGCIVGLLGCGLAVVLLAQLADGVANQHAAQSLTVVAVLALLSLAGGVWLAVWGHRWRVGVATAGVFTLIVIGVGFLLPGAPRVVSELGVGLVGQPAAWIVASLFVGFGIGSFGRRR